MNKYMKIFAAGTVLLFAAGIVACEDEPKKQVVGGDITIKPTQNSILFDATPYESQTVEVTVTGTDTWEVASQPEWVDVERVDNTLTLTAEEHSEFRERTGEIVLKADNVEGIITVKQSGNVPALDVLQTDNIPASSVSPNGRYVIGTYQARSFIYDRMTEELTSIGNGGKVADPQDISKGQVMIYDISNNGLAVGCAAMYIEETPDPDDIALKPCSYNVQTGVFGWLAITGAGIQANASSGNAWSVSADGSSISGFIQYPRSDSDAIEIAYLPVVWKNNVPIVLGHNLEGLGDGDNTRGYMPTSISADGSVVAGYLSTRFSDYVGCYWNMSEPEKVNFFLLDNPEFYSTYVHETVNKTLPDKYPRAEKISPDGKVITASIVDLTQAGVITYTPFNYNIETGEVTIARDINALGTFTTPSGVLVYTLQQSAGAYDSFFHEGGKSTSFYDWLLDKYSLESPDMVALRDVSQSGNIIVGSRRDVMFETIIVSL